MDIHIREGTKDDIPFIVEFQVAMAQETEDLALDRPTVTRGVTAAMNDEGKGKYYIAEVDGHVAGSLMLTYEWSDWRNTMVYWIQSVFVRQEFRGMGVFRQLYEHVKEMVENDPELSGIRLYVDTSNHPASQVYDRMGMNGDHYKVYEWMKEH